MIKISKKDYAVLENEIHDEIRKTFLKFVEDGKITLPGRSTRPGPAAGPKRRSRSWSCRQRKRRKSRRKRNNFFDGNHLFLRSCSRE